MSNEGAVVVPGQDTKEVMWTDPDPPDYDYASVGHGLVFKKEGAGQLDWGPTGIAVLNGTTFMVTPQYIGTPEGPAMKATQLPEKTLSELLAYSDPAATGLPAFGPRIDELDDYAADDQGYIPEGSMGDMAGLRPQKFTTTSIRYVSEPFDMGVRKHKNIQSVEVSTSLTCPLYVGLLGRTSPQEPFKDVPTWAAIKHPVTRAGFNFGAIEFMLVLWANGYERGTIEGVTVGYKLMDLTGVHSRPTLLRGAR